MASPGTMWVCEGLRWSRCASPVVGAESFSGFPIPRLRFDPPERGFTPSGFVAERTWPAWKRFPSLAGSTNAAGAARVSAVG